MGVTVLRFSEGAHYAGKPVTDLTERELRMVLVHQHMELRLAMMLLNPDLQRAHAESMKRYAALVASQGFEDEGEGNAGLHLIWVDPNTGLGVA